MMPTNEQLARETAFAVSDWATARAVLGDEFASLYQVAADIAASRGSTVASAAALVKSFVTAVRPLAGC